MNSIEFKDAVAFLNELKRLGKKYRSILKDVEALKVNLSTNPFQGADLGNGMRKVRMAISKE